MKLYYIENKFFFLKENPIRRARLNTGHALCVVKFLKQLRSTPIGPRRREVISKFSITLWPSMKSTVFIFSYSPVKYI